MEFFHAVTQRICSILHYEGKSSYYKALSKKNQSPMGANHILFLMSLETNDDVWNLQHAPESTLSEAIGSLGHRRNGA